MSVIPFPIERTRPMAGTYTVQPGDTLSAIANQYGTVLSHLIFLNPDISDPDLIEVGRVITVPDQAGASPAPTLNASPNGSTAGVPNWVYYGLGGLAIIVGGALLVLKKRRR